MKLTESVYLVGGAAYGYSAVGDCNIYLVDCDKELALIDAGGGLGIRQVLENVRRMGFNKNDIEAVFITHCHFDHMGGAYELKKATGCELMAHEADAASIESLDENVLPDMAKERGVSFRAPKLDRLLHDCDRVQVGGVTFHIVHTPGHTPGCISIHFEEKDGMIGLFTGDIASSMGRLGFINGPGFDLNSWKRSLKRLIAIKPERMYPGHNTFVLSGALEQLMQTDSKMNAPWTTIVTSIG
jgi:glyoxylase-like metal-dependent hydrolase (beta-lactamase superfamily II)